MINPWTKNPLLSLWLSSANAVWGATRGRASAELQRQMAIAIAEATRYTLRFWSNAMVAPMTYDTLKVASRRANGRRRSRTKR